MSVDRHEPFRLNTLKLAPTCAIAHSIARTNLSSLICSSTATLVLITAPAGYGKTTAMSQVFREMKAQGLPVAWLTLDPADNDVSRICTYITAALRGLFGTQVIDTSRMNDTPNARTGMYLLLDELSLIDAPFCLFLDECEHITEPEVLSFLEKLISLTGPGQRMFMGSRRQPNIQLGKLRVQNQLTELGTDLLRFSEEETRMFVRDSMQVTIDDADLRLLHDQTEGWAAALQLATTANRLGKPSKGFLPAGYLGSIAEYLAEEVLDRLPEKQRDFLLKSSILETFCPSMCDEIFGTNDSHTWITKSVEENLFTNRIDVDGDWYRYHPSFREFLQRECARVFGREIPQLHVRAALWLNSADRIAAAIAHAFSALDFDLAAELIGQIAMRYVRAGSLKAVRDWVSLLPQACLDNHPQLIVAAAYANTYLHRNSEAAALIAKLDALATREPHTSNDLLSIRIMFASWSDELSKAFQIAIENQNQLLGSGPYVSGNIQNVIAYRHICHGDQAAYHQSIASAKRVLASIDASHGLSYAIALEAITTLCQGDAVGARARAFLSFSKVVGKKYSSTNPVSASSLLETYYEMDDLPSMAAMAEDYLPMIREVCIPDQIIIAHRVVARMHVLQHHPTKALELLNILQDLGDARGIPRFSAAARLDRIWIAATQRDLETMKRLLPMVSMDSIWKPFRGFYTFAEDIEDPFIATCRYAILSKDVAQAIVQIHGAIEVAEATNRRRRALRLQCLLAQCYEVSRRRQRAVEILEPVLTAAQASGMIRVFTDDAWELAPILQAIALRKSSVSQDYLSKLMDSIKVHSCMSADESDAQQPSAMVGLSPRERQILKLLADGHSNKELAVRVAVTESTIEAHLHRINGKLGTRNRTQAVARGRELGIVY
ncbi:MAG: LuxR C-terminal-related transcriptional regulator [Pseudomonadota bacterium]